LRIAEGCDNTCGVSLSESGLHDVMTAPASPPRRQFGAEHIGTGLTLAYLSLVAIGMFHSALGYRHFGINILDYAEASDFLLAPFRDPVVMLVTVVPGILAWLYMRTFERMSERAQAKRRAEGRPRKWWESSDDFQARTKHFLPFLRVGLGLFWVFVSADTYQRLSAYGAMRGQGNNVRVELTSGAIDGGTSTRPLVLIGATSRYLFLFRTSDWRTEILPAENVLRIVPEGALPSTSIERRERSWRRLDERTGASPAPDSASGRSEP
jgi:hypothetical protein